MTVTNHSEIPVGDFRANVSDAINRTVYGGERVLVTRRGKPTAALISAEELAYFEELENRADLAAIRHAEDGDGGTHISAEELHAELGL